MSDLKYLIVKSSINGELAVPPSKSITHRLAICAALCKGTTIITNPLVSDDTKATVNALKLLGAKIRRFDSEVLEIEGPVSKKYGIEIDCMESGTTLRFLVPIVAALGGKVTFTGKGRLPKRKIKELVDVLRDLGAKIDRDCLPLTISSGINRYTTRIRGDISSQFISGLLFAFSLSGRNGVIELTTGLQSKPYVELTIDALERFGIQIHADKDYGNFEIPEMQKFIPGKLVVESDYSSAGFMLAAGALAGEVFIRNIRFPSKQGDAKIVKILEEMGANIERTHGGLKVKKGELKAVEINAKDIPDAVPILAVVATQANGITRITNAGRLRDKESDRLAAITMELKKMGAQITETDDGLEIVGAIKLNGAGIDPHGDHRIAMACSIAALVAEGETTIKNPECVNKSYPDFFKNLAKIGAKISPTTNILGKKLQMSVYGSSHGEKIGVILTGVPKGIEITREFIQMELDKRKSRGKISTARTEEDQVVIVSGIKNKITTGQEIRMEIKNQNRRGADYTKITDVPRPGHADHTAWIKYGGVVDMLGGGFFSGRMTACFVMAGAVAKKIVENKGLRIYAYTKQIGNIKMEKNPTEEELKRTYEFETGCPDQEISEKMETEIMNVMKERDSLGGIVECVVFGTPAGLGEPLFDSIESLLSHAIFSIPAIKGIEFGSGFEVAKMRGSENNDAYGIKDEKITLQTNNSGGIHGGITNGMPIIFRVAIKPTSSIGKKQCSVNIKQMRETEVEVEGRHDPCIVVRAPVIVESMTALVLADILMRGLNE